MLFLLTREGTPSGALGLAFEPRQDTEGEVFVHSNSQLRAAHLILNYTPISKSFQAPKCVIKPRTHACTKKALPFRVFSSPSAIPKGIPLATLPLQHTSEKATPSHPIIKEEEEEKEEEIVDVSDSKDVYDVFNQPLSPEISTGDLGLPLPA